VTDVRGEVPGHRQHQRRGDEPVPAVLAEEPADARTAAAAAGTSASPGRCTGPPASRDRTGPQRQYAVAS
jgi:hypothetical protein